jgi:hypothetical protein
MEPAGIEPVTSCLQIARSGGYLRVGSRRLPHMPCVGLRATDIYGCDRGRRGFQDASREHRLSVPLRGLHDLEEQAAVAVLPAEPNVP